MLQFTIDEQRLSRVDDYFTVSDTVDLRAEFHFLSEEWDGQEIFAIFAVGSDAYTVKLDENRECLIPWEVLTDARMFYVSVYKNPLHPTNRVSVSYERSGYADGTYPSEPTPTIYEQLKAEKGDSLALQDRELSLMAEGKPVSTVTLPESGGSGDGNVSSDTISNIEVLTLEEYTALPEKDSKTLYFIKG